MFNAITPPRKVWKWISDTIQSNNAEKGKMKNGLIALINGSFFFYVYVCYVRGNGSLPPRTGTDTWDEDCGYRPCATERTEQRDPSGCIAATLRPQLKMDSANWTWQTGEESPLTSPEMLAFSSTFLSLPPLSKGQFTALRCYKTQAAF